MYKNSRLWYDFSQNVNRVTNKSEISQFRLRNLKFRKFWKEKKNFKYYYRKVFLRIIYHLQLNIIRYSFCFKFYYTKLFKTVLVSFSSDKYKWNLKILVNEQIKKLTLNYDVWKNSNKYKIKRFNK